MALQDRFIQDLHGKRLVEAALGRSIVTAQFDSRCIAARIAGQGRKNRRCAQGDQQQGQADSSCDIHDALLAFQRFRSVFVHSKVQDDE
jgi:hypothetical protein